MYLADTINGILDSKKSKLIGRTSYHDIVDILNRAFRKKVPFRFRVELHRDYGKEDFSVSGLYDMVSDKKYVILNFSKTRKNFTLTEEKWSDFRFIISQVCQHETIHQCQWQHRRGITLTREPLDFRMENSCKEEDIEYLSDMDEIEAYAHDIVMEIKYFYPDKNPYLVLRNLGRYKKIWSYSYYRNVFKGTRWDEVHKRLMKKTYFWVPYVTV